MKGLLISGIVFFVGALFFWKNGYETYLVDRKGIIVPMKIEKLPASCIGAKVPYFGTFNYQGEFSDKQTRGAFCENNHVGELVRIKYLAGSSQILFPAQSGLFELIADTAIGLFGSYLIISQGRKLGQ